MSSSLVSSAPTIAPPPLPSNPITASPTARTKRLSKASRAPNARPLEPNVIEVGFGNLLVRPWYPSFYPEELVGRSVDRLYVCQWCFKYSKVLMPFLGHLKVCECMANPPGEKVYEQGGYSLWEVDGEECKLYAQNLSLFAKLFLDTKSVFYDVTTFLYYVLVAHDPSPSITLPEGLQHTTVPPATTQEDGAPPAPSTSASAPPRPPHQVVGFFSKEKMSWDNNNLACILVFPPWQKQGLGQILMGASYEMSKREGRLGGPEKPLSELGRRAYVHYWSQTLARAILAAPAKSRLTVAALRDETFIVAEDIIATLQAMDVLEHRSRGGADALINKARVREWVERYGVDLRCPVDPEGFLKEYGDEDDDDEGGSEEDEEDQGEE